jgi:hypothetical protein
VIEDCNKGITNPNGVLSGKTRTIGVISDRVTPTLYNIMQSDYSYRITSTYRREIINAITVAVATNTEVSDSGTTVVDPSMTCNELETLCRDVPHFQHKGIHLLLQRK